LFYQKLVIEKFSEMESGSDKDTFWISNGAKWLCIFCYTAGGSTFAPSGGNAVARHRSCAFL